MFARTWSNQAAALQLGCVAAALKLFGVCLRGSRRQRYCTAQTWWWALPQLCIVLISAETHLDFTLHELGQLARYYGLDELA